MKYNIDKELKSLSIYSGAKVGRLYPLINIGYKFIKCKSDDYVTVNKFFTPGYEGENISTLVIEPKQNSDKLPCVVFYHGGGFLMSASAAHYQVAKWYAQKAHCKVVLTDYRLLPKYKYPVAIEDCYNTYLWILQNAEELNIDKEKILLSGDSAGGNIASAVTVMLKDREKPMPKGVMLIYPVLDKRMITESMKKYTDTPIWDSNCTKKFWDMYLKEDGNQAKYASISEIDNLDFFPSTYIEVAEFDCLHDEGIAFAEKLQAEGINAKVYEVKGTCHGFEAVTNSSIVDKCINRRIEWIKRIYENE